MTGKGTLSDEFSTHIWVWDRKLELSWVVLRTIHWNCWVWECNDGRLFSQPSMLLKSWALHTKWKLFLTLSHFPNQGYQA